jgi:AraC-like DNA-binding protein
VLIGPSTFRRLVRARQLLAGDAHDELSVRGVAAEVGLSPYHFIRQFAAVFGDTPHQLRTRARLQRARDLLAGECPVTEVCMEVGFSSVGSFSALFTRWVGTSPTRWRRSVQVPGDLSPRMIVPGCLGMLAGLPRATFEKQRAPGLGTLGA